MLSAEKESDVQLPNWSQFVSKKHFQIQLEAAIADNMEFEMDNGV